MVMEYVGNTEGDKTVEMERAVTVRHVILSIYCHILFSHLALKGTVT
jgi:hypothetical protein